MLPLQLRYIALLKDTCRPIIVATLALLKDACIIIITPSLPKDVRIIIEYTLTLLNDSHTSLI